MVTVVSHALLIGAARLALFLVLPVLSVAAPWEFEADVELGIIRTDNLLLAQDGMEESEIVYTVSPLLSLTTEGDRTQASIRYRPEAYFYDTVSNADDVFHVLDASLTTALLPERLFLYLNGVNFQSSVTPEGSLPTTNIPVSQNRQSSRILEVRPYWQQKIAGADLLLEVAYRDLKNDEDQFQSSDERSAEFELNNFARQQGLAWGLGYTYRKIEFDNSSPFEFQRANVNLGFWASQQLRLFVSGGQESASNSFSDAGLDEDYWEAGFQYAPNERLNLEVAAGDRSFGTSYRAALDYRMQRGDLSLNYSESPASRSDTFFDINPIVDQDILDDLLNRPGNADAFVRKRGEIRATMNLAKSDLTLRVFTENREERATDDGMPLADEKLSGIAARWQWRMGARTSLNIDADVAQREDEIRDDVLSQLGVGLSYSLTPRTALIAEVTRAKQEGETSNQFDYTENQVRLTIRLGLK